MKTNIIKNLQVLLSASLLPVLILSGSIGYAGKLSPINVAAIADQSSTSPSSPEMEHDLALTQSKGLKHLRSSKAGLNSQLSEYNNDADNDHQQTPSQMGSGGVLSISHEDGSVSFSYQMGSVIGTNIEFPVQLTYNSDNYQDLDGFGTGYSLSIPTLQDYIPKNSTAGSDQLTLILDGGDSYSVGSDFNPADGEMDITSEPASGTEDPFELIKCSNVDPSFDTTTHTCSLPDNETTSVNNYGGGTSTISTWSYKVIWPNGGMTAYLANIGSTSSAYQSSGNKTHHYKTADGEEYDYTYYRAVLITNSFDSTANNSNGNNNNAYIKINYQSFVFNDKALQDGNYYDYALWLPTTIISDTGSKFTFSYSGTNSHSINNGSDNGNMSINAQDPKGEKFTFTTGTIEPPNNGGKGEYDYLSTDRRYPDRTLTKIEATDSFSNKVYPTSFKYKQFYNDYASEPTDQSDSANHPYEPDFGNTDSILQQITFPDNKTANIIFLTTKKNNNDGAKDTIDGIPLLPTNNTQSLSSGKPQEVYAQPYAQQIIYTNYQPTVDNINTSTLTCSDEGIICAAQSSISVEPDVHSENDSSSDYYMHDTFAYPYVSPSNDVDMDAQWVMLDNELYDSGDSDYLYGYAMTNSYTNDSVTTTYAAPHLLISEKGALATGLNSESSYSYGNYIAHTELAGQGYDYNSPTDSLNSISNQLTAPKIALTSDEKETYTVVGDPYIIRNTDGFQTVGYYNYQLSGYNSPYRHIVMSVYLPAVNPGQIQQGDDPNAVPNPSTNKAYAYFTFYKVDPETNSVTDVFTGYKECEISNNQYVSGCYASADIATLNTEDDVLEPGKLYTDIDNLVENGKQLISGRTFNYDHYGRLTDTYEIPYPTASNLTSDGDIDPNQSIVSKHYDFYRGVGQGAPKMSGIMIYTLHTSALNPNDSYWYVKETVKNRGDVSGSAWDTDPRTYVSLSITSRTTGLKLQNYWGMKAKKDGSGLGYFTRSELFTYDNSGFLREVDQPETARALAVNYWVSNATTVGGTSTDSKNQFTKISYYCPNSIELVKERGVLAKNMLPGKSIPTSCQHISVEQNNFDNFSRLTAKNISQYVSADSETLQSISSTNNQYDDQNGGVLKTSTSSILGNNIGQVTPIYNASHQQVGSFSQVYDQDGQPDTPKTYTNHISGQTDNAYTNKKYILALKNLPANQTISYGVYPCTAQSGDTTFCAKYMTISQYERVDESTTDSDGNEEYNPKSNRLISTVTYRSNQANGYPIDISNFSDSLDNSQQVQTTINNLLLNAYNQNQGSASDWSLSKRETFLYNIYNQLTTQKSEAYVPDTSGNMTLKHKIVHRYYDKYNRLIKVSNVDPNNLSSNGGMSANDGATDVSSTYTYYNRLNMPIQVIHYAAKNNSDLENDQDNSASSTSYREKDYLNNTFGMPINVIDCGSQTSGRTGDCSNVDLSQKRVRFNNAKYDYLKRLVEFTSNPDTADQVTHHVMYYPTGELEGVSSDLTSSSPTLTAVKPICFIYDFAHEYVTGAYYNPSSDACNYQSMSDISDPSSVGLMTYDYDDSTNQLVKVTYPELNNVTGKQYSIAYSYLKNDGSVSPFLQQLTDVDGYTVQPSYDDMAGLISAISLSDANNNKVANASFMYDNENRLAQMNLGNNAILDKTITEGQKSIITQSDWDYGDSYQNKLTISMQLDFFGELTSHYRSDTQSTKAYEYDSAGRLTDDQSTKENKTYSYDSMNNMTSNGSNNFVSNALDELQYSDGYKYGPAGNLIQTPTACYTYNARNQLTSSEEFKNNACATSTKVNYTIRVDGLRGSKVGLDANGNQATMLYFYNSRELLNTVLSDAGKTSISHYLGHVARVVSSTNNPPLVQYLISDLNGSVLGTFKDLDSNTNNPALAVYDANGNLTTPASSLLAGWEVNNNDQVNNAFDLTKIPLGFDGEYTDIEGNDQGKNLVHVYLRHREYSPSTSRFMGADPVNSNFNRTDFADDDPNDMIDPTGMSSKPGIFTSKYWKHGYHYHKFSHGWNLFSNTVLNGIVSTWGASYNGHGYSTPHETRKRDGGAHYGLPQTPKTTWVWNESERQIIGNEFGGAGGVIQQAIFMMDFGYVMDATIDPDDSTSPQPDNSTSPQPDNSTSLSRGRLDTQASIVTIETDLVPSQFEFGDMYEPIAKVILTEDVSQALSELRSDGVNQLIKAYEGSYKIASIAGNNDGDIGFFDRMRMKKNLTLLANATNEDINELVRYLIQKSNMYTGYGNPYTPAFGPEEKISVIESSYVMENSVSSPANSLTINKATIYDSIVSWSGKKITPKWQRNW